MKKIVCLLLAVLFCFSLVACGADNKNEGSATPDSAVADSSSAADSKSDSAQNSSDSDKENAPDDKSSSAEEKSADANEDAQSSSNQEHTPAENQYKTIEEYLNDPQVKKNIDAQNDESNKTVKMDVYAEDDTLVYEYTYVDHVGDEILEGAKRTLEDALEENAATFDQVVVELKKYTEITDPKVKIVYCNDDGTLIAEKVFDGSSLSS